MTAIKHILVPTDGSAEACEAASFAGDLARALGAHVSVLFVQSDDFIMPHGWGLGELGAQAAYASIPVEEIRSSLEKRVQEKELPDTVSALGTLDQDANAAMVWGRPADEICRFATEEKVDLIVIGSHGRTGIRRALLGSVSHSVVNEAPCPVTVVR